MRYTVAWCHTFHLNSFVLIRTFSRGQYIIWVSEKRLQDNETALSEFLLHVYYMNVFVLVYGQYHVAQKIFERYLAMDIESINVELMYQFCFSIIMIRFNYIERVIFRETKKYSRLLNLHDLLYMVPYLSFSVSCSSI